MFSIGTTAFFSKVCVFNNLLGVEEVILELASQKLKKLLEPNKLLLEVCNKRFFEKRRPKSFFHREDSLFLKRRFYRPLRF